MHECAKVVREGNDLTYESKIGNEKLKVFYTQHSTHSLIPRSYSEGGQPLNDIGSLICELFEIVKYYTT